MTRLVALRFASELSLLGQELGRIRQDLAHCDGQALGKNPLLQQRAAASKAAAYVWVAAALERVVSDALRSTILEISGLKIPSNRLRPSLFALMCDAEFNSVRSLSRKNSWRKRIELLGRLMDPAAAAIPDGVVPLDSRTVTAEHFDDIWLVLGVGACGVPSAKHRLALRDLADGRNEVAHGHKDPVTFGRKKAFTDLLRLVNAIEDVVTDYLVTLDTYLSSQSYLR